MSNYRDFKKCFVCRTKRNVKKYEGDKEVTILLNSLLGLLCLPVEEKKRDNEFKRICADFLHENTVSINTFGNRNSPHDLLGYLRNGIAHLNIETEPDDNDNIAKMRISNKYKYKACTHTPPCPEHCIPQAFNYKPGTTDINCEFEITPLQLKGLALFIAESYLQRDHGDDAFCEGCEFITEE